MECLEPKGAQPRPCNGSQALILPDLAAVAKYVMS